jgi:phosphatidylglycerol---prolipoprotein diacylglyceryl transferase
MYGIMVILSATAGAFMIRYLAKRAGSSTEDALNMLIFGGIGALVGSKLLYLILSAGQIIQYKDYLYAHPQVFVEAYLKGGFVFYGGLIGALIGALIYMRIFHLPVLQSFDMVAPAIPLMHAIARIGCFLEGCCYGRKVSAPWGLYFNQSPVSPHNVLLLPVQLIESGLNFILFLFLFFYSAKKRKNGRVIGIYIAAYAVIRFLLEFVRGDAVRGVFFGISTSQYISILLFPIGIALIKPTAISIKIGKR